MTKLKTFTIGIDASNLRGGGGITHLVEFMNAAQPHEQGIERIVIWGGVDILKVLPQRRWLEKRNPTNVNASLLRRMLWQRFGLPQAARDEGCDLLFVPGGSYFGSFSPVVAMSRNLLPFDIRELSRYGLSKTTLRLLALRWAQIRAFKRAEGLIFLTDYARNAVMSTTGKLRGQHCLIPHGLNPRFFLAPKVQRTIAEYDDAHPYRVLYVSVIDEYKHQWNVVEAVGVLRKQGLPIVLYLVGPAYRPALQKLNAILNREDPERCWVKYQGSVPYDVLHHEYAQADLSLFASSCENMPNILLESMASGLPIACSNRGPMPQVLGQAGLYFDPEQPEEIAAALRELIDSPQLRTDLMQTSYEKSSSFRWEDCAKATLAFLVAVADRQKSGNIVIGIDASRNRSGGAIAHLVGILSEGDPVSFGICEVHLWAYQALLNAIPDRPWLIKHSPPALERPMFEQLWWQRFHFPAEVKQSGCQIVLNTDAGTISAVRPAVTMSRDMLSYEPGEITRYGLTRARLRLILLRYMQNRSLRASDGAIFLTRYAAKVIQASCGDLPSIAYIPHGVGAAFKQSRQVHAWPELGERSIRCIYVSNTEMYKHQWVVVKAISLLRQRGHNLSLSLVGGGKGPAQELLQDAIAVSDPGGEFVKQLAFLPQQELPTHLARADLFVFASSCENMPNTLVEAMAVGLPIACSNRGPMPEVLADGGVYFDPEDADSIAAAIEQIIQSPVLRLTIAQRAQVLSQQYDWKRCSDETWAFVAKTYLKTKNVTTRHYQICSRTVMDTSDPAITFDIDGISNHCRDFDNIVKPNWHPDETGRLYLERLVSKIKQAGRGKDFDCLLGLSGGLDSSYMLHTLVTQFGLRPLVFHVDGGWNSEEAVHNINVLIDQLGLDLYTEVVNWEEMRDFQLAWFKSGVPHLDVPQDHAFIAALYKFAERYGIKYIINGGNISTECVLTPFVYYYWGTDMTHIRDIIKRFGSVPMKSYQFSSVYRHKIYLRYLKGVEVVKPLNFMPFDKVAAAKLLTQQYGWRPFPQKHFESRFTRFLEQYWLPTRFGYDVRRGQLSSLILTGQLTRDEALSELEKPPYDCGMIGQDFEYNATKLGISVDELRRYHEMPKKFYWDYENSNYILSVFAKLAAAFNLGRRGSAF